MKHPEAVKTASAFAAHPSDVVRRGACQVLSGHGTDEAIETLAGRLRANDKPLLASVIYSIAFSGHPRAGQLVFESVDFKALPKDENNYLAYAMAMEMTRIPGAGQNMLDLARQPDRPPSSSFALRYFQSFPREEIVPILIRDIEASFQASSYYYDIVLAFTRSPNISAESKSKLSAFITSGKVLKPSPPDSN